MSKKGFFGTLESNTIQITKSDLKLKGYKTPQEEGDDTSDETGKGAKELREFDHLEKHEVVGVINRVLKEKFSTDIEDANHIEQLIRDNYREWNRDREGAIKWLLDKYEDYLFEQGFNSIK